MKRTLLILMLISSTFALGCNALMKGNMALRNENYPEAIAAFKEQLAANPSDWQARERLGYAYLKSGDAATAVTELEKVVAQAPKDGSMSYLYLGLAQLKLDNQTAALRAWRSFDDPKKPLVKAEVDRLITLVEIEESKKLAKQALAQESTLATQATKPNSYAVFNFNVQGGDENLRAVQKALTAMTISDLAQIKGISVIERTRLQALMDEMKLGQSGAVDQSTAPKAGRLLGAENLVVGNLSEPTGKIGVASTTASTTRGAAVGSFSLAEAKDKFYDLQKQLVASIIKVNNIKLDKDTEDSVLKQYHTRSFQAVTYFGLGLDAQDRGDFQASKDYFALAVKEDPNFGMAKNARDKSPGGITGGLTGPASAVATSAIEGAVSAQGASDSSGMNKAGGAGGGGGGGGGC
ncbi:MAG: tetratricopeptide repeat protein [Humidesulfovibrio sp.]|uniref:tetratricopeptide repeat protein n=1 Tax=Humidesulfovibrio sp. TaxID=2910988 RepID=UPI0027F1A962|nr:tetratricopeptide repeat protein [Humidesulfovibrio sp.]MDQ7834009.1 tetratricopeptide repeat protein [Humidesulfovibrio sp.]